MLYNYVDFMRDGTAIYVGKGLLSRVLDRSPRNSKHSRVIDKYDVLRMVVCSVSRQQNDDCLQNEQRLITNLQTYHKDSHLGCNFTRGGEGSLGWVPSDETKLRISESVRANGFTWSDDDRQRMSLQRRGKSHRAWTLAERQVLSQRALQREPYVDGIKEFVPRWARAVVQRNSDGTFKTFSSVSVASRSVSGQRNALRGAIVKGTSYKSYTWEYAT